MKKNRLVKLLKVLPEPDELQGLMPAMRKEAMFKALITSNNDRIANITLLAVLMGTVNLLMNEMPDWEEYLDVSGFRDGEFNEDQIPEPCGDPECESCREMEALIAKAKADGAQIKVVKLSRAEAEQMGLDVTKDHDSTVKFIGGPNKDTPIH